MHSQPWRVRAGLLPYIRERLGRPLHRTPRVQRFSPACDHRYAETQEDARYGLVSWGGPRRRTRDETRRAPYRWDRQAATAGERRRVFCMSLGDFWDNQIPEVRRTEYHALMPQPGLADPDQTTTEHPQDATQRMGSQWMAECLAWRHRGEHGRGAAADSHPPSCAGSRALAIRCAIA